jgi:uncharacterized protein YbjQ (UPF0145 family)
VTVDGWDGRGLPPVAGARIARARDGRVRTSLLPVNGLAGLEMAGFDVVGEVLGAAVVQTSWLLYHGCGATPAPGGGWTPGLRWVTYEPYRSAVRSGWDNALQRMRMEAHGLGADGVVGVRLAERPMEGEKREFTALGTAVRSRGSVRPGSVFATDLAGQDVAKLLDAGWAPAGLVRGWSVAVTHHDWTIRAQTLWSAGNTEVTSYTELIEQVRADARDDFAARAAKLGADGALMSDIRLRVRDLDRPSNHHDHAAECLIVGTAIARFGAAPRRVGGSLTVLPVGESPVRRMPHWRRRGMTER